MSCLGGAQVTGGSKIKSDSTISLGENIRRIREDRSYTQAYMVRQMQLYGCSTTKQTYSKIEKDLAHISVSELKAIRKILNISYEELFLENHNEKDYKKQLS